MAHHSYLILESCFIGFGSREETLEELYLEVEMAFCIAVGLYLLKMLPCKFILLFLQTLKRV